MDKKEAEKVAAFLREYLKKGTKAITIVLTWDMVLSLYTLAEKLASGGDTNGKVQEKTCGNRGVSD